MINSKKLFNLTYTHIDPNLAVNQPYSQLYGSKRQKLSEDDEVASKASHDDLNPSKEYVFMV